MKLTANIKLLPSSGQVELLKQTLETCNKACNWISDQAWKGKTFGQYSLHKITYREVRNQFNLSAQMTVRCIAKVADAYKLDKKTQRVFRRTSAQPYDERIFRFMASDMISIWTMTGREKIDVVMGDHQRRLLAHRKGEVDLMVVKGKWYIACTCSFDDPALLTPEGILGVDFGIVNIATDSTGEIFTGAKVENTRQRYAKRRAILQHVGTKAAKKRLKIMSKHQSLFQKHENHCISKAIVSKAKRSSLSIAIENLKGIRAEVKARKSGRNRLHNWGFAQLRSFVEYKAKQAGVPVTAVDPRNTSRTCPLCLTVDKRNRRTQALFSCIACGYTSMADIVAAGNISSRAAVTPPMFAPALACG